MKISKRKLSLMLATAAAVAAVAVAAAGCGFVKPGSLSVSQPQGIGPVHVHFTICTIGGKESICGPDGEKSSEVQYLIGIAVPPGSTPPASFTATPAGGGTPILFNHNEEVTSEMTASSAAMQKLIGELSQTEKEEAAKFKEIIGGPWPPNGLQGVGYLSEPVKEVEKQLREWSVDAEFGLPASANGDPFVGPFATGIAFGLRLVEPGNPASRAVHCIRIEKGAKPQESEAFCSVSIQEAQFGISNLLIAAPAKMATAFVGGKGTISFPLKYGGSATAVPSFSLSATTTAKGGKAKLGSKSFTPKTPNAQTHLSPAGTGAVTVALPKGIKPGTYKVTLTAKTPQGGTTSGIAKLKVTKPTLTLGKAKANASAGTASLKVKVPGAGKLTISGAGVKTVRKKIKSKKPKSLSVTIVPIGSAGSRLAKTGSVTLKLKATFKPSSGISVSKKKSVSLKLG